LNLDQRQRNRAVVWSALWVYDRWLLIVTFILGILLLLPFLAPVLMALGWTGPANMVYTLYSALCHQMAQRSFFLFGQQPMYNLADLPVSLTGNLASDTQTLRHFVGDPMLGWKVAWSDRMVWMYGGIWLAGLVYGSVRRRRQPKPLRLVAAGLLALPMLLDGTTHLISDVDGGLAGGWRYTNDWLAQITGYALPDWFYAGDAFGSFNAWMRLVSGLTFGFACVFLAYPWLDRAFQYNAALLRAKLLRAQTPAARLH
jgi:uncharacterized membrane protein